CLARPELPGAKPSLERMAASLISRTAATSAGNISSMAERVTTSRNRRGNAGINRSLLCCERGGNWLGWMIHCAGSHGLPGGCGGTETEMARDFVGRNRGEVRAATLGGNTRG